MEEVDKALAKIINEIAPEIAPKLKKSLSLTLDALNGVLIIPKWILCDSVDYVMKEFAKGLEAIPEDEIIPILPEIGGEILQRLPIISSNDLRDLYAGLLIKASTKSGVEKIHPRFIQLLKSLSADEILIIKFLIGDSSCAFPYITPKFRLKDGSGIMDGESTLWTPTKFIENLIYPSNVQMYFINLVKLGIMDEFQGKFLPILEDKYKLIEDNIKKKIDEGAYDLLKEKCVFDNILYERSFYKVNQFGLLFLESLT